MLELGTARRKFIVRNFERIVDGALLKHGKDNPKNKFTWKVSYSILEANTESKSAKVPPVPVEPQETNSPSLRNLSQSSRSTLSKRNVSADIPHNEIRRASAQWRVQIMSNECF